MKSLKLTMMAFMIGFAIFFNIERLDFGEENLINISSFTYILGVLSIVSTFTIPLLQRPQVTRLIIFWFFIYLLGKVIIFNFSGRPFLGGIYTYLSITEVTLFLILIKITHWLVLSINRFETIVENLVFTSTGKQVRQLDEAEKDIQIEMFRSRNNHHPLSVIMVEPNSLSNQAALRDALQEVQQAILNSYVVSRMSGLLSKYLRPTDVILAQPGQKRFIILCPDTNAKDSKLLVDYLQIVAQEQLSTTIDCGKATFPGDALTFEDLVRTAEIDLEKLNETKKQYSQQLSTVPHFITLEKKQEHNA